MAGEITLKELSPQLREFIENSGGGGCINADIKTCGFTAEQDQTTFTIPFQNYVAEECYLDVKVNSIWVSPEEYSINGKEVTFNTALEVGTEVFFTVYLLGATAVSSVNADVVVENENKKFVTIQEKNKIAEIDDLKNLQAEISSQVNVLENLSKVKYINGGTVTLSNYVEQGVYCFGSGTTITDIPVGVNGWLIVLPSGRADGNYIKQIWMRWGTATSNSWMTYERVIAGATIGEWTQYATTNQALTIKGAPSNDLKGTTLGTYLTNTSGVTNLPTGWMQGRHTLANLAVGNETSYDLQLLGGYPEKALAFRIGSNDTWKQVATTTKTVFSCTAQTGYTLAGQENYKTDDEFVINLRIKKTDGTAFGITTFAVATIPFNVYGTIIGTAICRVGSGAWVTQANTYAIGNILYIGVPNSTITEVYINIRGRMA